jgi:multidrug efflux system membrane fusion protein
MNTKTFEVAALCLALGGCNRAPAAKSKVAVKVRAIEATQANEAARYSANILPDVRVDLAFKVGGYIEFIDSVKGIDGRKRALQEGDHVREGQVLARVKANEVAQKRSEVSAQLAEAQAGLEVAKNEWERVRNLYEKQGVSKSQFDGARAQYNAAEARVAQARAGLGQVSSVAADTSIRSPIDGMIMKRLIEVGSLVGPGTPGFVIADNRNVKAVFGVPDTVVTTLKLGTSIGLTIEALGSKDFHGKLTRVAPAADISTRVFEVEVTIPNPDDTLKPGMVASMRISADTAPTTPQVLLPISAIVRSATNKKGYAVYVVESAGDNSIAKVHDVQLGEFLGNSVPALSGLAAGQQVVVQGASLITDGEAVRIIP